MVFCRKGTGVCRMADVYSQIVLADGFFSVGFSDFSDGSVLSDGFCLSVRFTDFFLDGGWYVVGRWYFVGLADAIFSDGMAFGWI